MAGDLGICRIITQSPNEQLTEARYHRGSFLSGTEELYRPVAPEPVMHQNNDRDVTSVVNRRQRPDLPESQPLVEPDGGGVEIVHVETDDRMMFLGLCQHSGQQRR